MDEDPIIDEEEEEEEFEVDEVPASDHIDLVIVPPDERMTSDHATIQEIVAAISSRASAIERGSPILIDWKGLTNAIDIAKAEFIQRKNPFKVRRLVKKEGTKYYCEEWAIRDMVYPTSIDTLDFPEALIASESKKSQYWGRPK